MNVNRRLNLRSIVRRCVPLAADAMPTGLPSPIDLMVEISEPGSIKNGRLVMTSWMNKRFEFVGMVAVRVSVWVTNLKWFLV